MQQLNDWLLAYKQAWERQNSDAFVKLFTEDCEYRESPFDEPIPAVEFHDFWRALAQHQKDNHIDFDVLAQPSADRVIVNWHAQSTRPESGERREGDGIFLLTFAPDGRCSDLREWQHWHVIGAPLHRPSFTWKRS